MCHPRVMELETEEKNTMQQHAAYNNQQWNYYNELMLEIFKGNYIDYYNYLLEELTEGPYLPLVKYVLASQKKTITLTIVSVVRENLSQKTTRPQKTLPPTGNTQARYWEPDWPKIDLEMSKKCLM